MLNSAFENAEIERLISVLPKAELHVHLEGSIQPEIAVELATRHGVTISENEVAARYAPGDFAQFLDAFKWVTSFVRTPTDYALIAARLAEQLLQSHVRYAEVTLSVGVMFLRKQDPFANFEAMRVATDRYRKSGLAIQWIFDAVRQFGVPAARDVAKLAVECRDEGVVAFGMGGDELALPASDFRGVYDFAAENGLQRVVHAGEIGNAQSVRNAVEVLGVTRVGHGIAVVNDPAVMDFLVERNVTLEVCPTSNVRTGALARQIGKPAAGILEHPLRRLFDRGLQIALSTDDPAMFESTLNEEYLHASRMGFTPAMLKRLAEMSFQNAFLASAEKDHHLSAVRPISLSNS